MKDLEFDNSLLGTMPDPRLASLTGKHVSYIWRQRTKLGIPAFTSVHGHLPRFDYNIHAFDEINAIAAYWLGYYFSDGCVCLTRNRKLVTFTSCDYESVDKLADFYSLEDKSLIKEGSTGKGVKTYHLDLCNAHLFDRLVSLGCVPRKSNILQKPNIDENLYDAFLMGFFDGDGSVSLNRSINQWKVSIGTGGKPIFEWISKIAEERNIKFSTEKRNVKNGDFYMITFCGLNGKVFLTRLYESVPTDLPLSRKREKCIEMSKKKFRKGPNVFDWEMDYIRKYEDNEMCRELIEKDKRNVGWTRSVDAIKRLRRKIVS